MKMNNPIDDEPQWTAWLLGELEQQDQEKWQRLVAEEPLALELAQEQRRWMNQFSQLLAMPRDVTLHESQYQSIRLAARARGEVMAATSSAMVQHKATVVFSPRGTWQRRVMIGMAAVFVLGMGLLWREIHRGTSENQLTAIASQASGVGPVGDFVPAAQAQSGTLAPLRMASSAAISAQQRGTSEVGWLTLPARVTPPWNTSLGAWHELEEKIVAESTALTLSNLVPTVEHAAALLNDVAFARVAPQGLQAASAATDKKNATWHGLRVRIERMRGEGASQWVAMGLVNDGDQAVELQAELILADRSTAPTWQWRGCGWLAADTGGRASDPVGFSDARLASLSLQPRQQATLLIELMSEKNDPAALSDLPDSLNAELILRVGAQQRRWSLATAASFLQIADFAHSSVEMQHLVLVWRFAEWLHRGAAPRNASGWVTECRDMQRRDDSGERRRARAAMLRAWQRAQEQG